MSWKNANFKRDLQESYVKHNVITNYEYNFYRNCSDKQYQNIPKMTSLNNWLYVSHNNEENDYPQTDKIN